MRPETRFARSGDVYLAYQVLGSGERELVVALGGLSHLEAFWATTTRPGSARPVGTVSAPRTGPGQCRVDAGAGSTRALVRRGRFARARIGP